MWLRNILAVRGYWVYRLTVAVMMSLSWTVTSGGAPRIKDQIVVVYPKPDQLISAVDSTFILGHIPPERDGWFYRLEINNQAVDVHRDGGFIAYLPLEPGEFTFQLDAFLEGITPKYQARLKSPDTQPPYSTRLTKSLTVFVPKPQSTLDPDSLVIVGDYDPPRGDLVLSGRDRLVSGFRGTPGCRAWFSIDGVVDSVPMAETSPRPQPYWGEAVFGTGAVPESLMVRGVYTGFYDLQDSARADSVRVKYHLAPPSKEALFVRALLNPEQPSVLQFHRYLRWLQTGPIVDSSHYTVTINNPRYPFTVKFTDSVQIVRHGPGKGYLSIFQPKGIEVLVIGAEGSWYRTQLSSTQFGWIARGSVEELPKGILPTHSYLSSIRTIAAANHVLVEFPLKGVHPFRIEEQNSRTLVIQLFGVTSNTDWIRYDFSDPLIDLATWSQVEPDLYQLKLELSQDIWGYEGYYKGNTFYCRINRAPDDVHNLRGKTIVVDPGHSADPGAIGPTGYTEAEANLRIALALRKELRRKGAKVVMTREDDRNVALYDRPSIAKAGGADLFVSIHNNALPDGVNPFENNGTSTYYYHPHSINLARAIQKELLRVTKLRDHGLYYGNLAVNRPTQYPAVLVECAFMILPEQEAALKNDKFCKKVAKGIVKGIERFLKEYSRGK